MLAATVDSEKARLAVNRLNDLNRTRRELVEKHFGEILSEMAGARPNAAVLYRELVPKGIAGLLASKCVEHFGVPSIVLVSSATKGIAVGSGRSVPGFDLEDELRSVQELFERFGGHPQAIGLTINTQKIDDLKLKFLESTKSFPNSRFDRCSDRIRSSHSAQFSDSWAYWSSELESR